MPFNDNLPEGAYLLICEPYGQPNRLLKVDPSNWSEDKKRRECVGFGTFSVPLPANFSMPEFDDLLHPTLDVVPGDGESNFKVVPRLGK